MKCTKCEKPVKGKKEQFDYSKESFNGVTVEVKRYVCKHCKNEFIEFPYNHDINKQICELLLTQDVLKRNQLGYIFKQILNMSVFQVAKRIGTNPQHLNDVIKFKKILSQNLSDQISELIFLEFKSPRIVID